VTFIFDADGVCQRVITDVADMHDHRDSALEAARELLQVKSS
jgi:hypothetical protein